jgi:hypothetical protein
MPELSVVKDSENVVEPTPKRRPNLHRVLADRLRKWEPADYNDEFLALLEMIRDAQIPKRYQSMMVRAIVAAYIRFDWLEADEKGEVADTIASLDGRELVSEIYRSSSFNSRRYILLHHLGYHLRGGLR